VTDYVYMYGKKAEGKTNAMRWRQCSRLRILRLFFFKLKKNLWLFSFLNWHSFSHSFIHLFAHQVTHV